MRAVAAREGYTWAPTTAWANSLWLTLEQLDQHLVGQPASKYIVLSTHTSTYIVRVQRVNDTLVYSLCVINVLVCA